MGSRLYDILSYKYLTDILLERQIIGLLGEATFTSSGTNWVRFNLLNQLRKQMLVITGLLKHSGLCQNITNTDRVKPKTYFIDAIYKYAAPAAYLLYRCNLLSCSSVLK